MKTKLIFAVAFSFAFISARSQNEVVADMLDTENKPEAATLEKNSKTNEFLKNFRAKEMDVIAFQKSFDFTSDLIEDNKYDQALPVLLDMAVEDSKNANLNFNIGVCYFNSTYDKLKCIPYFEKALKNTSLNYSGDINDPTAPVYIYYLIAQAYQFNYEFGKAQENYSIYLSLVQDYKKDNQLLKEVGHKLATCGNADYLTSIPKNVVVTLADLADNTDMTERNFIISKDLVFFYSTSSQNEYMQKYNLQIMSNCNGDLKTNVMNAPVNTDLDEIPLFYDPEVNELFFAKQLENNADIFVSRKKSTIFHNNEWTEPIRLSSPINSEYNETGLYISEDGNFAIFSSDRPGGFGGKDLYECKKNSDGNWSEATNLGNTVNTEYDEDAPVFSKKEHRLYFVSNSDQSMGGFDVFFTAFNDNGKWDAAQNMGYPINTSYDEISYFPFKLDAYVNSNRPGGIGDYDIYRISSK